MAHFTQKYHRYPYAAINLSQPGLSQAGNTVVITGGATGIGLGIAEAFIAASAARVVIASRNRDSLETAKSKLLTQVNDNKTIIDTHSLDISSTESVSSFWALLAERGIEVDVLVLCAMGIDTGSKMASLQAFNAFKDIYDINVMGNWNMAANFIAQGKREGKALVNISSAAAHLIPLSLPSESAYVPMPLYSITKATFVLALQAISDEVPKDQTQILSLHPGAILTGAAKSAGYDENSIPWDDVTLPSQFVVWAASQQASFLHGRFLWANWDVEELKEKEMEIRKDDGFLKLSLKGPDTVHPIKMWDQIKEKVKTETNRS